MDAISRDVCDPKTSFRNRSISRSFNDKSTDEESPPVVKLVSRQTNLKELFRWGIKIGTIGNHRILYIVHNYYKVVLLYYFNKQYNGDIKREDIEPAEEQYFKLLRSEEHTSELQSRF